MGIISFFRELFFTPPPPSGEERRLLKAIALDPSNDSRYLEYGEWLKCRGNEWGEFVLLDHQLEQMRADDPHREPLDARWSALHEKHAGMLFKRLKTLGLRPLVASTFLPTLWMKYGVIREVTIDHAGILPERAEELFTAAPGLQRIQFHGCRFKPGSRDEFEDYEPDFASILSLPQFEQISELEFSSLKLDGAGARALAQSPVLRNLLVLTIDRLTAEPEDVQLLAASPNLRKMRVLNMQYAQMDEASFIALVRSPHITELRSLAVGGEELTVRAARAIAEAAGLVHLEVLSLPRAAITGEGAQLLAVSPHLRRLRKLELSDAQIDATGATALANSLNLANVVDLMLSGNSIGCEGASALAASPHLGRLKTLELARNNIGERGTGALSQSANALGAERLDLDSNPIGNAGAAALAASALPNLRELGLNECQIGLGGLDSLLSAKWIANITHLRLGYNPLGEMGAQKLAGASTMSAIESLSLYDIGDVSAETQQRLQDRFGDALSM